MSKIFGIHVPEKPTNLWINGNFDFWQRVAGNTTTVNTTSAGPACTADRVQYFNDTTSSRNYSIVRSTDVPTQAQSGFQSTYSYLFTMVTGFASALSASDRLVPLSYKMEGNDYAKIHGKVVTFSFWVKASIAGTYSFVLANSTQSRNYTTTFTVSGANTWEFKSLTVQLDSSGTWNFDNTTGLWIQIGCVGGSSVSTSNLNQWTSPGSVIYAASGVTNYQATTGATLRFAQMSVVEGSLGVGSTGFLRAADSVEGELSLCQRYYEKTYDVDTPPGTITGTGQFAVFAPNTTGANIYITWPFSVTKRGNTGIGIFNPSTGASGTWRDNGGADLTFTGSNVGVHGAIISGSGTVVATRIFGGHATADAEL